MPLTTEPLYSVVIPSHNRPDFLKRAIQGLEHQELNKESFEVIIILSPEDLSFAWLKDYDTNLNLTYLWPEEDIWHGRNVSFKRNHGAKIAKAKWVAFIDDDCMPEPTWLSGASEHTATDSIGGIEGKTIIPEDSPKTLTWKGARRLSNFGGYQTCNIIYRKQNFLDVGGFDSVNFPWLLEDTDIAWAILHNGQQIVSEPKCRVVHPIGPRASWRLLHEAKRAGLKIKLFKKYPEIYKEKGMKALRLSHYVYLSYYLGILLSLITQQWNLALTCTSILFITLFLHMIKTFRGLEFTLAEVYEISWRTLLYPVLALWSLFVEKFRSKLSLKDFFFMLKP